MMQMDDDTTNPDTTALPLDGVRVVDLTGAYGPFGPRLLADLGAEVVRIEGPGVPSGEGRFPRTDDGLGLWHVHRNLNKGRVRLDVTSPDGARALDGLLAGADVVFLSTAAVAALDPAAVASRHPHLVVTVVTPFGLDGPAASWKAPELVAQSLAGSVYRSGVPELPPVAAPGSYCEDVGATVAAVASLMALWQVRDGGHGQVLDVSSILALGQCMDMSLPLWSLLKFDPARAGAGLYPLFECRDGLARLVLPMAPQDWRSLIAWLGSPPEWTGPAWEQPMLGPDERAAIVERLPAKFAAATRAEISASGDAAGVRVTPVLAPAELLTHEHVVGRGTFATVDVDGTGTQGSVTRSLFGIGGRRDRTPSPIRDVPTPAWSARPAPSGAPSRGLPLAGIRVLEVGSGVAAPEAGRVLAEWGADVIKVETQRRVDFQRRVMGSDMNPAFSTPNRCKRDVSIDLATEAGRDLIHRLLPSIDVIVENNATGVIDRLGLGWDTISAINPGIVLVGTQLYGDRGPWAERKGYGPSARSIGGVTWLWAHGPDQPRGVMTIHPDHLGGRLVALASMAGLLQRERTGRGARFDIAQFEAVSTLIGDLVLHESISPGAAQPVGNRSPVHAPWGVYRCADETGGESWLAVCAPDDATWRSLVAVAPGLDRPEWAAEADRWADRDAVDAAVGSWLRDLDAEQLESELQAAGVAAGRALHPRLQAEHPHFVARGFPVEIDQPGCGKLILEGGAWTGTRMGSPRCTPAPMIGEHTAEVLSELLGITDADLAHLVETGAIESPTP